MGKVMNPHRNKADKEIIIMNYTVALSVAAKATAYLQDNEGSTSEAEAVLSVYALHHALKAIAKHNSLEDLEAKLDE